MLHRTALLGSVAVLALAVSCKQKQEEAPAPVQPVAEAPTPPPQEEQTKMQDCVGPITTGTPETVTIGGTTWEIAGSSMTQKSPAKAPVSVIGAVTDIKEDTEENKANLRVFANWFKDKKAEMIIVAGDTGESKEQIVNALSILAEAGVPVFAVPGNREGMGPYKAAMAELRAKNVFDLSVIRYVDAANVDVVSLPGYFNANYIHAEDGCQYQAADVASVGALAKAANSPVLVVSHGGPKQEGPLGIDRTSEGDNVGDPALTRIIAESKIPFGVFGNIHEAGGHATDLSGKTAIKEGELASALYLHPGPADAVRWVMNDKSESVGMAALLTIKGNQASYVVHRIADERKLAKKGKK